MNSKKLRPEDVFVARDQVLAALERIAISIDSPFVGGPWWLTPTSSLAGARDYGVIFGRNHLREWTEATAELSEQGRDLMISGVDLVVDLNSGPSFIGLHTLLLGETSRLLAVDWSPAAGELMLMLATELGLGERVEFTTAIDASSLQPAESVAVLASHALNCRFQDRDAQLELDSQNRAAAEILCDAYSGAEVVLASLEPAASSARGLMSLAEPWTSARFDVRTNAVTASPQKFRFGADSADPVVRKRFAATRVAGPFMPLDRLPVAEEFETPFGTRRLSFAPSQPTRLADLGRGPVEVLTEGDALALQLDYATFRESCENASRVEREELFSEPFEPSTRWAEAIALLEDFAGGVR